LKSSTQLVLLAIKIKERGHRAGRSAGEEKSCSVHRPAEASLVSTFQGCPARGFSDRLGTGVCANPSSLPSPLALIHHGSSEPSDVTTLVHYLTSLASRAGGYTPVSTTGTTQRHPSHGLFRQPRSFTRRYYPTVMLVQ